MHYRNALRNVVTTRLDTDLTGVHVREGEDTPEEYPFVGITSDNDRAQDDEDSQWGGLSVWVDIVLVCAVEAKTDVRGALDALCARAQVALGGITWPDYVDDAVYVGTETEFDTEAETDIGAAGVGYAVLCRISENDPNV